MRDIYIKKIIHLRKKREETIQYRLKKVANCEWHRLNFPLYT